MLKRVNLKIESQIENLGDGGIREGDTELSSVSHVGAMKVSGGEYSLSYRENTEGGSVFTDILVHESGAITVRRSGAIDSTMHFDVNEEYKTVYSLPPYKFDMSVRTQKIKNSLSLFGGVIEILYSMSVGGAEKQVNMKIEVSEEKR